MSKKLFSNEYIEILRSEYIEERLRYKLLSIANV
jgi:hypothetical protein